MSLYATLGAGDAAASAALALLAGLVALAVWLRRRAALFAFGADFDVWKHKRPALRIMQLKKDGPFKHVRKWYAQFYAGEWR